MFLRLIASDIKIYTESEVQSIENVHLAKLQKEIDKNQRLTVELNHSKNLIARLTERIIINDLNQMLFEWGESEYKASEAEDREQFARKIFNYMSNIQHL